MIVAFDPSRRAVGELSYPSQDLRVLVVDDEEEFGLTSDLVARAEETHFRLDWAHNVEAALGRLSTTVFDACLVAHALPGRSGLDLVHLLHGRGLYTPIVLVGEGDLPHLHLEAIQAGVADFIEREEFDVGRLERVLRAAVVRHLRDASRRQPAPFDPHTGLASRSIFEDRLRHALALAARHAMSLAVLTVDLDGIKGLDERLGREGLDNVLVGIAGRLASQVRATDTMARLGPEQFAILAEGLAQAEDAAVVARKILKTTRMPIAVDGVPIALTASIGVAVAPLDGNEPDDLLAAAATALARAKVAGGSTYRLHDPRLDERTRRQAALVRGLDGALERRELALLFQPQVTLRAGHLGLASVLQWRSPDLGTQSGDALVAAAEEAGLIEDLTDWMLSTACRQARLWHDRGFERVHVAVPLLSRRSLAWAHLADRVQRHLELAKLPASWIEIEIPEELLLDEVHCGGTAIRAVADLGVRLALRDYGTGPTSIAALRGGALSTVKLAPVLLRDGTQDQAHAALLSAVLGLARQLGLRIVAQGIETQTQLQLARSLECDAVQSILSCPPLPADACTDWLVKATRRG